MQLWMLTSLFGVAVSLAVVYALIRLFVNDAQRDPLHAARSHGMVTALIALFATGTSGLSALVLLEEPPFGRDGSVLGVGQHTLPVTDVSLSMGLSALTPALWLPLVYWVAQRTWPAVVAPTRSARLTARSWTEFLPRSLTVVVGVLVAVGVVAALWLWSTPGRPMEVTVGPQNGYGPDGGPAAQVTEVGARGGQLTPWHLVATVLFCLAAAVAVAAVLRRRALAGLTPVQDDAVRHVAVNRILRTLAIMLLGVIGAAGTSFGYQQHASGGSPAAWSTGLVVAVTLVMLGWRSSHLAVLREQSTLYVHADGTAERVEVPRGPGTLSDVIQLRHTTAAVVFPFAGLALLMLWMLPLWAPMAGSLAGMPLVYALAPSAPLAVLWIGYLLAEFVLRMRHTDRTAAPSTRGVRASTWRVVLFGVVAAAGLVAAGWAVREQRPLARLGVEALPLAVGGVTVLLAIGLLTAVGVRVCLHRRPLARTSSVMDRRMRRRTADRMIGIGTAGLLLVLATAAGQLVLSWSVVPVLYLVAFLPALVPGTTLSRPLGDAEDPADGSGEAQDGGGRPSSGSGEDPGAPVAAAPEAGR